MAPPFREAEFDIMYGEGISHFGELIDLGVKLELVQKSGSWFSIGETRIGQGRDAAKRYLQENPETVSYTHLPEPSPIRRSRPSKAETRRRVRRSWRSQRPCCSTAGWRASCGW